METIANEVQVQFDYDNKAIAIQALRILEVACNSQQERDKVLDLINRISIPAEVIFLAGNQLEMLKFSVQIGIDRASDNISRIDKYHHEDRAILLETYTSKFNQFIHLKSLLCCTKH